MVPFEEIFCFIDDFCKCFQQHNQGRLLANPKRKRHKPCRLTISEIMTILVLFQFSHYRTFKNFYLSCLIPHYKQAFPNLVSYNRFVELTLYAIMPLQVLLMNVTGQKTGRYFVDATKLFVCDNRHIYRHKVFQGIAQREKTSTGWFFGPMNFLANVLAGLMAYALKPKKPSASFAKNIPQQLFLMSN